MGLGLEGAYGAAGAADALRQLIKDRFDRERQLHAQTIQDQTLANQTRVLDQNDLYRTDQLAETKRLHDQEDAKRQFDESVKVNESMLPTDPNGPGLPGNSPLLGRLMSVGGAAPRGLDVTPPSSLAADPAATNIVRGSVANAPSPGGRTFDKLETSGQQNIRIDNQRAQDTLTRQEARDAALQKQAEATLAATNTRADADRAERRQYHQGVLNKPTSSDTALVKVEHKDPNTGRTVIEYLPKSEVRGKTYEKGVGSATEARLSSAMAVNQTGNDIIAKLSDPAYAAVVGPVMGRAGKLQDWIGNPPPELAELAGAIESYSLANMGVHGMRSAQGAQLIAKMLNQPHSPESIIAAIRGLNSFSQHFMENENRTFDKPGGGRGGPPPGGKPSTGSTAPTAPTAEELIRKYRGRRVSA